MCITCGCGGTGEHHHHDHDHEHEHSHGHDHHHEHEHEHEHEHSHEHDHHHHDDDTEGRLIKLERDVLSHNDRLANANREWFLEHDVFALNLVSSPGSGKTSLLVKSIEILKKQLPVYVIEGDQQTSLDADRIKATGAPALQVNTGKGCHLDAHMVGHAVEHLNVIDNSVLFIENVGNLVCPAAFDLGEAHKVAILSVTEGDDKPLKYPDMFAASDIVVINKSDLLPYVDFDIAKCREYIGKVAPDAKIIELSVKTGEGMDNWINWLKSEHKDMLKQKAKELEAKLSKIKTAIAGE